MGFNREVAERMERIINRSVSSKPSNDGNRCYVDEGMRYIVLGEGDPEILKGHKERGGGYWRPKVLWGAAQPFGVKRPSALYLGAIIEAVHCATLALDDLPSQDNSDLRRGRPSAHKYFQRVFMQGGFSEEEALQKGISVTDLASHQIFTVFEQSVFKWPTGSARKTDEVIKEIHEAKRKIIDGKERDLFSRDKMNTLDAYIDLYRGKTGYLFGAAAAIGGIVGNRRNSTLDHLRSFGEDLGIAYQLADDVLDRVASAEVIGKPVNQDATKKNIFNIVSLDSVEETRKSFLESARASLANIKGVGFPYLNCLMKLMEEKYHATVGNALNKL